MQKQSASDARLQKRNKKRKIRARRTFRLGSLLTLCIFVFGIFIVLRSGTDLLMSTFPEMPNGATGFFSFTPHNSVAFGNTKSDFIESDIDSIETNNLIGLINNEYPINSSKYATVPAFRTVPVTTSDLELNNYALKAAEALFAEAEKAGYDSFFINSGYRTYDKQKQLYDDSADKSYVQKPNHSEHQTGLAIDIAYTGISEAQTTEAREFKWLAQNAWKYGLILRYPEDKTDITKIAYEPWHFRYIGLPHSYYCYENDLCLEEYIEFLKETGGYDISLPDGTKYSVFYETPQNGKIQTPKDLAYEVSNDNTGGFIVTVRGD